MSEIDYTGVREFIALILDQQWSPRGQYEYIRLSMNPTLEQHLPEGISVDRWGWEEGDGSGLVDCRLKRARGWKL